MSDLRQVARAIWIASPGPLSSLPKDKRGTLWTCADPKCRAAAMERRKAVLHER